MSVELHFSHFKFRAETKKVDISVRVQVEKQSLKWRVNRAIQVFPEAQNKEKIQFHYILGSFFLVFDSLFQFFPILDALFKTTLLLLEHRSAKIWLGPAQ